MTLLIPLFAAPILHFARVDDRVLSARFWEVREEPSAHAVWKKADGDFRAWHLPDRRVVRAERLEGGAVIEVARYDVSGRAESRVRLEEGVATEVVVDGGTVDVRGWIEVAVGPVSLTLPPGTGARRVDGNATVDATLAPPADVFSPSFAEGLASMCGCRLHGGATTWLGAEPAARFTAELGGSERRTAELWAVPVEGGTLLVASSAPEWTEHTLIRAAMALYDLR